MLYQNRFLGGTLWPIGGEYHRCFYCCCCGGGGSVSKELMLTN